MTLHLAGSTSRCCSLDDADDARRVAEQLGIRFYVANYTREFRAEVMLALRRRVPLRPHAAPLRHLQHALQVRPSAGAGARARRGRGRHGPLRAGRRRSRERSPDAARGARFRQGPVLLPVRSLARAARARALSRSASSTRPTCAHTPARWASPPPRSPRVRSSASCPTATPRAAVERLRPGRAPGPGDDRGRAPAAGSAATRASTATPWASGAASASRAASRST